MAQLGADYILEIHSAFVIIKKENTKCKMAGVLLGQTIYRLFKLERNVFSTKIAAILYLF